VGNGGDGGGTPRTRERPRVGTGGLRRLVSFSMQEVVLLPLGRGGDEEEEEEGLGTGFLESGGDTLVAPVQVWGGWALTKGEVGGLLSFAASDTRPALLRPAKAPTNAAYDDRDELPTSDVEARAVR